MIYTILLIIFILFICTLQIFLIKKYIAKEEIYSSFDFFDVFSAFFFCYFAFFTVLTIEMVGDINKANQIKSKIILMKPMDIYKKEVAAYERELSKVEKLIETAFDKNQPNVSVKIENGIKIYSFMGSTDFGSAELGNAEKQKLLIGYIEKQNEIADKLINISKLAYGDEYYKLQQDYCVCVNNLFSGWMVKWFSVKENYLPIKNQNYELK
jgi:hypothetical protein